MCQACGVCVAECPAKAIDLVDHSDSQLSISPALPGATIVFACENSALLAADSAGLDRKTYSPDTAIVPVPCAGRVDPVHVLRALRAGAKKVLILGCHDQACKYLHGINRAKARIDRLHSQLTQLGLDPDCVQIGSLMAADAGRFVDFVEGPNAPALRDGGGSESVILDLIRPSTALR
jgi:coenzyme F420-reducing hydrogenase delta subunit